MKKVEINHLNTERRNPNTQNLDSMSILEIITLMNEEDKYVLSAVKEALPDIEKCIKLVIASLNNKGRLIYIGAGTSGRLGILDAVECVPTFSTTDEVIGIIAGGNEAFVKAVEGAEDSYELAVTDLKDINLSYNDTVVAIAASGRTPYTIGALKYAREIGAKCACICCNKNSELSKYVDVAIEVNAGPEILAGSTRLKCGTCQKIILNMISTVSMVGIGKVYCNLMVDMKATNLKLIERAKRIIMESTQCDYDTAENALNAAGQSIKTAIVMLLTGYSKDEANERLAENNGFVGKSVNLN